ncbi:hypothetical protein D1BOALGB6SA_8369 [Olavius sp. associated proteobacterium Delta 1]|nr:hypothetical protein D1BOALGB6SA_8369 [Olavius sp. associated proteobacterium Delta 1]
MFPELITELLQDGYKVNFSAPGHSMYPTIMANETILVEPIDPATVRMGDILLYRTNGRLVAHRVIQIEKGPDAAMTTSQLSEPAQFQIPVKGQSPLLKHRAPQVNRPLSETLYFVLRGDACLSCDAPVTADQILGKVVSIERNGCSVDPYSFTHKLGCLARRWTSRFKAILN